jgi:murein DD-endopeptidase MepM/ murein hydrolase activator NlpD
MRLAKLSGSVLLTWCLLGAAAPASADTGGSPSPSADGGTQVGTPVKRAMRRPVAKIFRISPERVPSGKLPSVTVRIDQYAVRRVELRVAVVRVGKRVASATLKMPSAPTGRLLKLSWPTGTKITAGHYVARVHVKSPDGATLRRTGQLPGRTKIAVTPKPRPKPNPKPVPAPSPYLLPPTQNGVFPVVGPHSFGSDGARFGAGRTGHTHEGQDIVAASGLPVVAPLAGTIIDARFQSAAGYYVAMNAADGRSFFFAHCRKGTTVVKIGDAVATGQRLCDVGATGVATGPHLHFEIWIGGWRRDKNSRPIDPLPQLQAWDR